MVTRWAQEGTVNDPRGLHPRESPMGSLALPLATGLPGRYSLALLPVSVSLVLLCFSSLRYTDSIAWDNKQEKTYGDGLPDPNHSR